MTMESLVTILNSVFSSENNGCVTAILKYEDYQVTMNFIPDSEEYYIIMFGEKGTSVREIDASMVYMLGFEKFVEMLRTQSMPTKLENLEAVVETFNSLVQSFTSKLEVFIG